jgi:hypothetical protein
MELLSKSHLKKIRNIFEQEKGNNVLFSYINESKIRDSRHNEITVFLSHKHDEVEILKDAIALLKRYEVNIYIDHFDDEMPKNTSGVTAVKLKKKIKDNKKFILLATERAIASKWCNWELGYGDAHKYINNIALLVVKDDNTNWSGSEYLEIYPVINLKYNWSDEYYQVELPDGTKIELKTWLNS